MKRSRGFTLIELMVGVALGLLATLVIAQVFLQSEGNKRTTTSGTDAQVTGASALYTLQRDIQAAGYGLTAWPDGLGCPLAGNYDGTVVLNPATDFLAPVVISFGAASVSDTITVMASGKSGYSVPIKVAADHPAIDTKFLVASNLGVAVNDIMLAMPVAWSASNACTVFVATGNTPTTEIPHAVTSKWNLSTGIYPSAGYPANSMLINLGPDPVRRRYSVNTSSWSLQVQDTLTATNTGTAAQEMFSQVVLVKALYGVASVAGGAVTSYTASTPSATNWRLVQSIRIAVVVRSSQYEKTSVTSAFPQWSIGNLDVSASGSADVTDPSGVTAKEWTHYRYKVFETVVPLRNVVWNQ